MSPSPRHFDVIVVGAGPAGSLAAKIAAQQGVSVALLEEHPQAGSPVQCAEGTSLECLAAAGIELTTPITSQKINRIQIFAPNGTAVNLTSKQVEGYNLNRQFFDKALADNAEKAGAELMVNTRALGVIIENGAIVGVKAENNGEQLKLRSKIVIGADGHSSIIRRSAGLTRYFDDYGICAQYTLRGLNIDDPTSNQIYIGKNYAPGAYAWVFPKSQEVANVGLGVRNIRNKSAIEQLDEFIKGDSRFIGTEILGKTGGICPATGTLDKIVENGLMLIGDAAGQLLPISGAGIHTGIVAGKIAGKVAAQAVEENNVSAEGLMEYPKLFDMDWGKRIRDSRKMLDIIEKFSDEELNTLSRIITQEDIVKLVNGTNVIRTITGIALRDPIFTLKILAKL